MAPKLTQQEQELLPVLETWLGLNEALMTMDEKACHRLFELEMKTKRRKQFVFRIHSRLNRLRTRREVAELKKKLTA